MPRRFPRFDPAPSLVKLGCKITFTRYFYKAAPLRTLEETPTNISALEQETNELLVDILQASGRT